MRDSRWPIIFGRIGSISSDAAWVCKTGNADSCAVYALSASKLL